MDAFQQAILVQDFSRTAREAHCLGMHRRARLLFKDGGLHACACKQEGRHHSTRSTTDNGNGKINLHSANVDTRKRGNLNSCFVGAPSLLVRETSEAASAERRGGRAVKEAESANQAGFDA